MSNRRLKANHRNSKKSTGPRTDRGKSRSSLNALKHGLRSKRAIFPGESSDLFNVFCKSVISLLEPVDLIQASFAETVASGLWRLRRSALIEDQMFAYAEKQLMSSHGADATTVLGQAWIQYDMHFARLRRYQTSEERSVRAILFEFSKHSGRNRSNRMWPHSWRSRRLNESMEMLRNEERSRSSVDFTKAFDVRLTDIHSAKSSVTDFCCTDSNPQGFPSNPPAKEQTLADAKVSFKQLSDSLRVMDKRAREARCNPSRRKTPIESAPLAATSPATPEAVTSATAVAVSPSAVAVIPAVENSQPAKSEVAQPVSASTADKPSTPEPASSTPADPAKTPPKTTLTSTPAPEPAASPKPLTQQEIEAIQLAKLDDWLRLEKRAGRIPKNEGRF